jgi:MGT family glycosyltransferase
MNDRWHIAHFSFPGFSHVTQMLGTVDELVRRGHRVSFVVADKYADMVRGRGAEVVPYHTDFPEHADRVETADDALTMIINLMREGFAPLGAALQRFADDPPDLFMYDTIAPNAARVLARGWGRPLVESYIVFAMNENKEIPGAPSPGPDHPAAALDRDDPRLAGFAASFGEEISRLLAGSGLDIQLAADSLEGGDEKLDLVFLPRSFQFGGDTFSERYRFVGPAPAAVSAAESGTWTPPGNGLPIVLISLGTASNQNIEFFRTCVKAFAGQPWHVVMALGPDVDPASLGPIPANLEAHSWVAFSAVLRHASVIVTAAGTGSLLQALRHEVPVVAVPQSQEQETNAYRIAELGLGSSLTGEITCSSLLEAVRELAGDTGIAARMAKMREDIEEAGGAARACDELEAVLAGTATAGTVTAGTV